MSDRAGYIGGANIAGILGISPYRTPLDEYYTILGEDDAPSDAKQAFFDGRKEWEPVAFRRFERLSGLTILRTNTRYTDPQLPWAKAEIDFEPGDQANGETKTCRPEVRWLWGDPETDEPPLYVTAQVMWGLGVTAHLGKTHTYVQRFDLDDNAIYRVEADEALIADIRERAAFFWTHHIEKKRPPQPTTAADMIKLYGRGTERAVEATSAIQQACQDNYRTKESLRMLDARRLATELDIKKFMKDASVLTVRGQVIATWKADKRGIRTLRLK